MKKITRSQLKSIIKEELERMMEDGHADRPSAIRKLKVSMEKAHEILGGLRHHQGELPAWWMSKVTKAADYLNSARDYFLVSGELMEDLDQSADAMDEIFGLANGISANIRHLDHESRELIERDLDKIRALAQMEVMEEKKLAKR
jgi:hypothetical protein